MSHYIIQTYQKSMCIYEHSRYYTKAFADPLQIAEPVGYKFLNNQAETKKVYKKKQGELVYKFVVDKNLIKQISSKGTKTYEIYRFLMVSRMQRKNFYLSGVNLDFVNKQLHPSLMSELKTHFFGKQADNQLINFLDLVGSLNTISDNLLSIKDYSLSTYFVYYHGENLRFYKHLQNLLTEEFIEYDHQILISSPKLSRPQLRKINYSKMSQVFEYIRDIKQIGKQTDSHFNGVHLYICDYLPELSESSQIVNEESELWQFLQFNILIMMRILADGQHAALKIRGTYTHKTSQYIFLLKLAFSRVYLVKNILSNPFSSQKYIICEFYNKENGGIIADYLEKQYDLIYKEKAEMLLVDPKCMFNQDFQINITNFNDLSPIIKVSKDIINQFSQNSNIQFYPNKQVLLKKITELKLTDSDELVAEFDKLVPNTQKKQKDNKDEIFEKEAIEIDFSMIGCGKPETKVTAKKQQYCDISQKKNKDEDYLNKYMSRAEKNIKQKKEKSKKKKYDGHNREQE